MILSLQTMTRVQPPLDPARGGTTRSHDSQKDSEIINLYEYHLRLRTFDSGLCFGVYLSRNTL